VSTETKEPAIELHEVPSDRQRIDRTKRIKERAWKAIEANYFFTAPSAMNCGGCPFRESCRRWPHS
jgi:CRISPR/Cas system-associated exonuclease Cas4 (RecB family)